MIDHMEEEIRRLRTELDLSVKWRNMAVAGRIQAEDELRAAVDALRALDNLVWATNTELRDDISAIVAAYDAKHPEGK